MTRDRLEDEAARLRRVHATCLPSQKRVRRPVAICVISTYRPGHEIQATTTSLYRTTVNIIRGSLFGAQGLWSICSQTSAVMLRATPESRGSLRLDSGLWTLDQGWLAPKPPAAF